VGQKHGKVRVEAEQLRAFVAGVRGEIIQGSSQDATARAVRRLLQAQLATAAFPLDCIETALDKMSDSPDALWNNPPLWEDYECAFLIRVFFWTPGFANQPHRHDEWTVTGVLHNALTFHTYLETASGLVVDRRIEASAGDVGYISSPCTHNVSNDTQGISVSLHVFSGVHAAESDGGDVYGEAQVSLKRAERARALGAFVELARCLDGPRRLSVLERIFGLGDPPVKLASAKAIAPLDPELAALRLGELAGLCSASVADELNRFARRLSGSSEQQRASLRGVIGPSNPAPRPIDGGGPVR